MEVKETISAAISTYMSAKNIGKIEMASFLGISRCNLDRLLDPTNESITLKTIIKVAHKLGYKVRLRLV